MAEKVTDFEFPTRGGRSKYHWKDYTDGAVWKFHCIKEFDTAPGTVRASAANYASANNLSVETAVVGEFLFVRFTPKEAS